MKTDLQISEFGNKTTHSAQPYFPVDYLVVSVNGPTFPTEPDPTYLVTEKLKPEPRIPNPGT